MSPVLAAAKPGLLLERADLIRAAAARGLDEFRQRALGQFFTPASVAGLMASMFHDISGDVALLDPGAGVGVLTAAFVQEACSRPIKPASIRATVCEMDETLLPMLERTLGLCEAHCRECGVAFSSRIVSGSFLEMAAGALSGEIFESSTESFSHAILNPPYRKIACDSRERRLASAAGLETSNLYTAFAYLACRLLRTGGELVAITPRSFCNGPYFRPFREYLHRETAFRRIHVFEARDLAFAGDDVLQENVIFALGMGLPKEGVSMTASASPDDEFASVRLVAHADVVHPGDPDLFVRLLVDESESGIRDAVEASGVPLATLGVSVSTGRVVDFRARELLRKQPEAGTAPLLYPAHLRDGAVAWPLAEFRKCNAIADDERSAGLLVPAGNYVLVKRFSAKEERRRIVAALLEADALPARRIGLENHLNYYHSDGAGLDRDLAAGLCLYLNSTMVDRHFRQFSGHTQVNATDLRSLPYPPAETLRRLGRASGIDFGDQDAIDRLVEREVLAVAPEKSPLAGKIMIDQALEVLGELGLPREQRNERSALALLALLGLKPGMKWSKASAPLCGITQMMAFFAEHYGKEYAPNTRETVRRLTMHQFVQAGMAIENPDEPNRPTNSPKWCYQASPRFLEAVRARGTRKWRAELARYLAEAPALGMEYARERKMRRIPVRLRDGKDVMLSPGGQNVLVKAVVEEFCPRFTPGAEAVYVGDTADKWAHFDDALLARLGVAVDSHGKMPDVVVYLAEKNWLILVETVTSHGPVNPKRHRELRELFAKSSAGLVFVSAFPDRRTLLKHLADISWETEVWCADSPTHLIHFNGERFLGPHE